MNIKNVLVFCILLLTFCGCSTVKPQNETQTLFYPALPEEPRIQFLASFSSSKDVEGEGGGLSKFVLGKNETIKPIVKPYGVTLRKNKIYITDTVANTIDVIDLEHSTFSYLDPKENTVKLKSPINLEISQDGRMFLADAGLGQVLVMDPAGNLITALGSKEELKPTDVAIFGSSIYVCDLKSSTVRVYNLSDYSYQYSLPKDKDNKETQLFSPTNLDVDLQGNVYVSDTGSFNVRVFKPDGSLLKILGTQGDRPGQLARNKGVAVDKEGRVYIVDAAIENVQIFDPDGKLLLFFPPANDPASLVLPAGIFIDYDHVKYFQPLAAKNFEIEYLILVTSQYGDRKLSIFGFGHKK